MTIIDNVKMPGYTQWIEDFVERVISTSDLHIDGKKVDAVKIVDIDDKRIYLSIYDLPFIIRTWNYISCEQDSNKMTCGETVEYTLFFAGKEYTMPNGWVSANGKPICSGILKIKWSNDPAIYQKEIETYNKLHGVA